MSRKIILAVAVAATLGAGALMPTSASAFGHFGGTHQSHARSSNFHVNRGPILQRQPFNRGPHFVHNPHHPDRFGCHHHNCGPQIGWWHNHRRPYWVNPVATYAAPTYAAVAPTYAAQAPTYAAPVAKDNCNCLTKSYLPDGSVMFKDLCTKEMAMATPDELKAQAEGAPTPTEEVAAK